MATASSGPSTPKFNPFGDAKPVDVSAKERAISERVDKEREAIREKVAQPQQHSMSRTNSRTGMERSTSKPGTQRASSTANATVRPAVSFANAAGGAGGKLATEESKQIDEGADDATTVEASA
jgi:translation initiation factor 4B